MMLGTRHSASPLADNDVQALLRAVHPDPFSVLGMHRVMPGPDDITGCWVVRAYLPGALGVDLLEAASGDVLASMEQPGTPGLFVQALSKPCKYRLRIRWAGGVQEAEDPYSFGALLGDLDLHLFAEGKHRDLAQMLGAQVTQIAEVPGVRFAVWAPNARRVSVVGDFNAWDGRRHPMRLRHGSGVWEIFLPRLQADERYKYEVLGADGNVTHRADPMARRTEIPPATASIVAAPLTHEWGDTHWLSQRPQRQAMDQAMSIYEVHVGSWRRRADDTVLSWSELAEHLLPYVVEMGFTHIELMPIMEHPFGGSWGYQVLSQFAPSARYGSPEDFAAFVDACHQAGVGVILDWVPAHFPTDAHGLAHFDGTALYEYSHPFEGFHQDWNTFIYNLGRNEVHGFMIASALYWLREFHVDALRVDAVASMLYRDYSRKEGEWIPNIHGGRENLEAIDFLRHLNTVVASDVPGALVIAEESTAFPGVSHPVSEGGLGFAAKWNMGWMHDSLKYISEDPIYRRYHHHQLTFGLLYAFTETFVLPISHDEVVHGKGSLLQKMPGDRWQKFANLRAYLSFMWTHPGKKLLFMGCELGSWREWNHDAQLDWGLLEEPDHQGLQLLLRDLNRLYRQESSLHGLDQQAPGFRWLVGDDDSNSVYAWLRSDLDGNSIMVVVNFTPVPRSSYRVGAPAHGNWAVILNSDASCYGGTNAGSASPVHTDGQRAHGEAQSLELDLPPLGALVLRCPATASERS